VVVSLTATPASVGVSAGPATVTVTAHITDDASGVSGSQYVSYSNNSAEAGHTTLSLSSGNVTDGIYTGRLIVNQYKAAGTYALGYLRLEDAAGNSIYYGGGSSTYRSFPSGTTTSIEVTNGCSVTGPDVTAVPGMTSANLSWQLPSGACSASGYAVMGSNVNAEVGTALSCSVKGLTPGMTYTYSVTAHTAAGDVTSAPVFVTPDNVAPTLVSVSVAPTSVDVTNGTAAVTVTARVTDAASEVRSVSGVTLSSGSLSAGGALSLASGTAADGTYTATVTVPRYVPSATWSLGQLSATDKVGNTAAFGAGGTAFPAGSVTSVAVTDNAPDTTAPTLVSLLVSPGSVDVTGGPASVTVTARVTDRQSGASSASVAFTDPRGALSIGAH